jgi:DNA-binding transcriptional LysR family regulator
VSLEHFTDHGWILPPANTQYGLAMRHACRRAGFEPIVEHEVTDTGSSLAMVAGNLGITPVTDLMLTLRSGDIRTVELRDDVRRKLVLAYRGDPEPQPSVQTVIDVITESVRAS